MTDIEILLDLLSTLGGMIHSVLEGMPPEQLRWQPDEEANNIAVTAWHISRSFDVFRVRFFEDRPAEEELWHVRGWAAGTGYDPRGIGWRGYGNLARYTKEEVDALPELSVEELLTYFDQVHEAMVAYVGGVSDGILYQQAMGMHRLSLTVYHWLRNLLVDGYGHVGEIKAIKAMWERRMVAGGDGAGAA